MHCSSNCSSWPQANTISKGSPGDYPRCVQSEHYTPRSSWEFESFLQRPDCQASYKIIRRHRVPEDCARRVVWARSRLNWKTRRRKVIFSNENKFNLEGPDGFDRYYHDKRKPEPLRNKRHSGGGGVMVWAAFSWHGKTSLAFINGSMDSAVYQATLAQHLLPLCRFTKGPRAQLLLRTPTTVEQRNSCLLEGRKP